MKIKDLNIPYNGVKIVKNLHLDVERLKDQDAVDVLFVYNIKQ